MKLYFTLALVFIYSLGISQKVDLDKFRFKWGYKRLPTLPLPEGKRTFKVSVKSSTIARDAYSNEDVINNTNIDGFKRVEGKAHMNIDYTFGDLMITSSSLKDRVETNKDNKGVVTSTTHYYKTVVVYDMVGAVKVTDQSGTQMVNKDCYTCSHNYETSEFTSSTDANNYYRNSYQEIRRKLARERVEEVMRTIIYDLNMKYGYTNMVNDDYIWVLASKKHPEFQAQQDNWKTFLEVTKGIQGDKELTQDQIDALKPCISYFNEVKKKFDKDEKADRKMRYSAYYALANLYIMIDDLDAATAEAEGLIKNEYDDKDGKRLLEEIEKTKKAMEINHVKTRHYFVDPELNQPPK
jgi:hypothetical protein